MASEVDKQANFTFYFQKWQILKDVSPRLSFPIFFNIKSQNIDQSKQECIVVICGLLSFLRYEASKYRKMAIFAQFENAGKPYFLPINHVN